MTSHKLLALASLVMLIFPLRYTELSSRTANDCKCDLKDLGCKIVCSGVGSGEGTGGGTSTFDVTPRDDKSPQERPIVVPGPDIKSTPSK
jgi:hypothetical protein